MKKIADFCCNLFVSVVCVTLSTVCVILGINFVEGAVKSFKETPSEN